MDDSPDTFLTRKRAITIITALGTTVAFLVGILLLSIFHSPTPIAQIPANTTGAVVTPTVTPSPQKTVSPTPTQTPSTSSTPVITKATPQPTKEVDLKIKGNRNSMIYHLPGCASYDRLYKNVEWFKTEEEAEAAGYRKARNCW